MRALSALILVAAMLPASAEARRVDTVSYRYEQVWSSTIRMLRVDYGFAVRDSDRDIGYVLFQYDQGGRQAPGSIELVRTVQQDGYEEVQLTLNIPQMPSYIERMIHDRLERKLREDHGAPLVRAPTPRPVLDEDADEEDDEPDADDDED